MAIRTRIALFALALVAGAASAQSDYPSKPVRIMVGANAGGGTDIIARMLGEKFAESLKQPFVVENRPGASNTIAADLTAKAPADGYTLLVATNTGQAIAPHLLKLSYDPLKQLQPVGLIVVVPNVLVVGDKVAAKDVKELVAMAKAKPGELKYASSGIGSTQHIAGEAFDAAAGIRTIHVPYKGSSQAHVDILGGNVEMMFDTTSSAMPHIKSGRFRPLAVTSPTRSAELPNVPTIAEMGYAAAEMTTWYGMFVTGGTPKAVVDKLHAELVRVLKLPDVQAKLRGLGGEPGALTIDQFAEMNKAEYERFGKLIRAANIKAE
ncbi:MAG: tripartite tricarboxylate transporter substrate binding protein [Betaproteobacteria bacterium]|jgi:tripartite-type tricarboxylate transporter receptor subunit TctC|nr:tripartite tricarboxylate transporter substrate binding protein [Betaproteobacteria bacterium]MDH5287602.1 tripartite tricarboxylate transporter substrate binding protein [Betaproteobacteria bacterium]